MQGGTNVLYRGGRQHHAVGVEAGEPTKLGVVGPDRVPVHSEPLHSPELPGSLAASPEHAHLFTLGRVGPELLRLILHHPDPSVRSVPHLTHLREACIGVVDIADSQDFFEFQFGEVVQSPFVHAGVGSVEAAPRECTRQHEGDEGPPRGSHEYEQSKTFLKHVVRSRVRRAAFPFSPTCVATTRFATM